MRYDEYKDSQTPWMGTVPNHWALERAKWSFTLRNERGNETPVLLAATQKHGMYPQDLIEGVVKVAEGTDVQQFRTVHRGDFVISLRSFQGGFERSDYEGVCSPAYQVFYANDRWDTNYLKYLFKNELFIDAMNALTVGIREGRNIKYEDFANSVLAIPPISEQNAIADFLDKKIAHIDSIIAEAKASIEEYKAWKASIIYEAVTKGLYPEVEMKDSGVEWIGDIPDTWSLRKIKNIASTGSGGTPKSDVREYYDGGINWVCSLDLHEQSISETKNTLSELGLQNCASEIRPIGTVVMAMYGGSGTIGNSGILRNPCATNQAICCVMFDDKIIPDYGFYYIRAIRPYWMIYAVGTRKDPNISQAVVSEMPMVIPSLEEQKSIVQHLDKTIGAIDCLIEEKETLVGELESYKKSLVFEVVTGKRRVC